MSYSVLDRFVVLPLPTLYEEPRRYVRQEKPRVVSNNPLGRSGIRGVYLKAGRDLAKPWYAMKKIDGRLKHLGYFATKEQAAAALSLPDRG